MTGGRIFDADPERVPQDVIAALQDLSEQEDENATEMRRQKYCNATGFDGEYNKMSPEDNTIGSRAAFDQSWMITVPDEYMHYQIPESVVDDAWRAKEAQDKKDILAGKLSVRDVEMPDLSKFKKVKAI